jgi:hypothetical protein
MRKGAKFTLAASEPRRRQYSSSEQTCRRGATAFWPRTSLVVIAVSVAALAGGVTAGSGVRKDVQQQPRAISVNGTFEQGLSGWRGVGAKLMRVRGASEGRFAARVVARGRPRAFAISRRLASTRVGALYTTSASIRSSGSRRRICLRLRDVGPQPPESESCARSSRRWRRVQLVHRAVGGPLSLSVSMRAGTRRDRFDVDAVVVRERVASDAPPARKRPLWTADHETGDLSQWSRAGGGGEFNSGNADTVVSTRMPRSGRYSAEMTLTTMASGTRLFRWREPERLQAAYYSAWYYIPRRYTVDEWWNIFQFKSRSSDGSRTDPFWVVNVGNRDGGSMYLYLYDWMAPRNYGQRVKNLPPNQWVHIEAFLEQSANRTGRLVIWQDAVKLFDLRNITTKFPGGAQHWSVNNYGDGIRPRPATIFVDDAAVSPASPP